MDTGGDPGRRGRAPSAWSARHPNIVRIVAVTALAWGGAYLVWRIGWTRHGQSPVLYWPLFVAEAFGWISLSLYAFLAWRVPRSRRPPITTERSVDVFVCTYDEPVEVVHATLTGCQALTRPHTTYLLDDGRRPEMEKLADRLDARYLSRPDNEHAKAGNINAALGRTHGELIAMLDADHVPLPDFLDATLGYFDDPQLALVQTPHDFYNRDSMQHTTETRHEQSLFYDVIAPGKDRHNAAFWCGSATVIRREALEEVGGVRVETVAEDFHTTLAMQSRGWRTRYHHETLVQGLAPHDLAGFLLQRDRWARGNLRVFRTKENPLTCPGLSLKQRISYTASLLNYFSGIQRLTLLSVLIATLLLGRLPLHATIAGLALFWLPWSLLAFVATGLLARGSLGPTDSTRYGLLTMGIFTRSLLSIVSRKTLAFRVTPKEGVDHGGIDVLRALPLVTIVAVVLLGAWVLRMVAWLGSSVLPPLAGLALAAALVIGAYELAFLGMTLVPLVRRRQLRTHFRFHTELAGTVGSSVVRVVDLTPQGFALEGLPAVSPGDGLTLHLRLPGSDGDLHDVDVPGVVTSVREPDGDTKAEDTKGSPGPLVGCRTVDLAPDVYDRLVEFCFVVQLTRDFRTQAAGPVPETPRTGALRPSAPDDAVASVG